MCWSERAGWRGSNAESITSKKLREYAERFPNGAVKKRLGYLFETLVPKLPEEAVNVPQRDDWRPRRDSQGHAARGQCLIVLDGTSQMAGLPVFEVLQRIVSNLE
jgi:hypothetical protein